MSHILFNNRRVGADKPAPQPPTKSDGLKAIIENNVEKSYSETGFTRPTKGAGKNTTRARLDELLEEKRLRKELGEFNYGY